VLLTDLMDARSICLFCPSRELDSIVQEELTNRSGINPFAKTGKQHFIWEEFAYSKELLHALPEGWPLKYSQLPAHTEPPCPIPGCAGVKTKKKIGLTHYLRHAGKHLPDMGYYFVCPLCGEVSKRLDNLSRHLDVCKALRVKGENGDLNRTRPSESCINDVKRNVFLR
jgi:hypothetical protein